MPNKQATNSDDDKMTYERTKDMLKYMKVYFVGKFDNDDFEIWYKKMQSCKYSLVKKTIEKLNEDCRSQKCRKSADKKFYAPKLNEFMATYYKIEMNIKAGESHRVETNCCDRGIRYAIQALKHQSEDMRMVSLQTNLCKGDENGTNYIKHDILIVPCDCNTGTKLNKINHLFGFDVKVLPLIRKHSFDCREKAETHLRDRGIVI